MVTQILTAVALAVVTAVMGVISKVVMDWSKREKERAEIGKEAYAHDAALEAIEAGVAQVQTDLVNDMKAAASDHKLTKTEIKAARDKAIETAKKIATGPALDYLARLATDAVNGLIDLIVQGNKKK